MAKTTLLKRAELRQMFHETESSRAPSAYIGYMKTAADAVMDLLADLEAAEARVKELELDINELEAPPPTCDVPECNKVAGCGTPTITGYRWTCFWHRPGQDERIRRP